jgi:CHASE3 domain sensor protein
MWKRKKKGREQEDEVRKYIEAYKNKLREKYTKIVRQEAGKRMKKGRYLYQGGWYSLEEINELHSQLTKRERTIFFDLVLLLIISVLAFLVYLLFTIRYIR